jgi:hypothetical protein
MKLSLQLPAMNEWVSIFKGGLVAGAGVALTYIVQHVSAADFGVYGPMVVGILSVIANILRKSVSTVVSEPAPVVAPEVVPPVAK